MTGGAGTVEQIMQRIESLVLEEVWLGRSRCVVGSALAAMLCITAAAWRIDAKGHVPTIAALMLLFASVVSGLALARRHFRWCCAAAYSCGLASVFGIGAFWWLRTGRTGAGSAWLMLADVAVVALTIFWLTVIITPIERSQPDMRSLAATARR